MCILMESVTSDGGLCAGWVELLRSREQDNGPGEGEEWKEKPPQGARGDGVMKANRHAENLSFYMRHEAFK